LYETYGEDVHLASRMGESYVKGHQGSDLKNTTSAATCLKHYIGYSQPTNGFDRTDALIPDTKLREYFLPPFESGVSSGSLTVMLNSAHVNGIPGHANSYYINEILKGELNFQGFVVSDWQDIIRLHTRDKVAETQEEAVRIAVMAGVDMSMVPQDYSFYDHCVSLSKRDKAFAKRIDDASMRILKVKNELNLFGNPYPNQKDLDNIGLNESQQLNLDSARESIILAKNDDNTLPLKSTDKILVTGPTGNILRALNGGWSYTWQGDDEEALVTYGRKKFTVYQSIATISESVEYLEGATFTDLTNIDEVIDKAKESDVILLCIGEDSYAETLGNINDLKLSESQLKLGSALLGLNKTVVVVYLGGRPRLFTEIADKVKAVIIGFFPGERGGEAIAEILFGRYIPNGRLPITYPKYPNGYSTYEFYSLPDSDSDDR
jgi:beta-glucosidase